MKFKIEKLSFVNIQNIEKLKVSKNWNIKAFYEIKKFQNFPTNR